MAVRVWVSLAVTAGEQRIAKVTVLRIVVVDIRLLHTPAGERNFLIRSGLRMVGIGRMKLRMAERARMPNAIAGSPVIEP